MIELKTGIWTLCTYICIYIYKYICVCVYIYTTCCKKPQPNRRKHGESDIFDGQNSVIFSSVKPPGPWEPTREARRRIGGISLLTTWRLKEDVRVDPFCVAWDYVWDYFWDYVWDYVWDILGLCLGLTTHNGISRFRHCEIMV